MDLDFRDDDFSDDDYNEDDCDAMALGHTPALKASTRAGSRMASASIRRRLRGELPNIKEGEEDKFPLHYIPEARQYRRVSFEVCIMSTW